MKKSSLIIIPILIQDLKKLKLNQWLAILLAILIVFFLIYNGTGGYDQSAERPNVFDQQ